MKVFEVYWYPNLHGDHEKEFTYIFAHSAREAMADPYFKGGRVAYAEEVTDETAEDARRYHWCVNDPMRNDW